MVRPAASEPHQAEAKYSRTLAQQLLEDDLKEAEELFALLEEELRALEWLTSMLDAFPGVPAKPSSRMGHPLCIALHNSSDAEA